mmetsp:Transcript_28823/g.68978  ORF Transcript_28823/g.68978 Transcript_28823/m.68978 type:complete len:207 (-) Transcript_28823:1086-1706(-)
MASDGGVREQLLPLLHRLLPRLPLLALREHPRLPVRAPGSDVAVGKRCNGPHSVRVPDDAHALVVAPDADGAVLAPADDVSAGQHRQRVHEVRVPDEGGEAEAAGLLQRVAREVQRPDLDCVVVTGGDEAAVGEECEGADAVSVATEGAHTLLLVPQLDRPVGGGGEELALAEGEEGPHRLRVPLQLELVLQRAPVPHPDRLVPRR